MTTDDEAFFRSALARFLARAPAFEARAFAARTTAPAEDSLAAADALLRHLDPTWALSAFAIERAAEHLVVWNIVLTRAGVIPTSPYRTPSRRVTPLHERRSILGVPSVRLLHVEEERLRADLAENGHANESPPMTRDPAS